tara:strand:- start:3270 stop:3914 length:645 start_codon:yes stop_codon:yes gene_type:complete
MDEEVSIIDSKTRSEKIKNFLINNRKKIILFFVFLILILVSFYSYRIYENKQRQFISDKYNNLIIEYQQGSNTKIISSMKEIVLKEDSTYSPLALYFLIDEELIKDRDEINDLFDILIKETSLEKEIKNLIIYKKALYNADFINENELIEILKPIINSESVWKSHSLFLLAEYFYAKKEKQKSVEFFKKILNDENANKDILRETQKRINRDFSE